MTPLCELTTRLEVGSPTIPRSKVLERAAKALDPICPCSSSTRQANWISVCLGRSGGSDQIHESIEHGGNASLGIAGSPAVEPSVLEEWGQLLCVGHRIHVRGEQQAVTGTFRGSIGQKKVLRRPSTG